jgi:hypothetical protein
MQAIQRPQISARTLVVAAIIFIVAIFLFIFSSQFFYFFEKVDAQEVGVQFQSGRIKNIVGPGIYSDFGLFVEIKRVSSQAVPFSIVDEELITADKQRIGLVVTGDIFRPGLTHKDQIQQLWAQYNQLYTDDEAARERIGNRAKQAMKVCVGDRNFNEAVIGTARDELRNCIDTELDKLAGNFGLSVQNVAVPDVVVSPEVQAGLDAIVRRRLETEAAAQEELKAKAEAAAEQARQEGEIRVAQSRIQEEARQQKLLADLDQQKIVAQKAVIEAERANELARVEAQRAIIEAEKSNELFAAQSDLEIQTIEAQVSVERAKADVATELALAELVSANPGYMQLQVAQANADALKQTDKLIFLPEGTSPTLVLPGPGIMPTIETGAQQATTE